MEIKIMKIKIVGASALYFCGSVQPILPSRTGSPRSGTDGDARAGAFILPPSDTNGNFRS
jgi:hypothetical protein